MMRRSPLNLGALVAAGIVLACTSAAFAQNVDPGAIERESQRQQRQIELQDQPKKLEGPAVVGPRPAAGVVFPAGGAQLLLRRVVFEPSRFISEAELDAIAAKYIGTRVDLAALQRMVEEINALYAAKGVITGNASLPPQNVTAGTVKVRLVEGQLNKLSLEGNVQTSADYIKAHFPMQPGEVLDSPDLSRRVAWFNRTSDVQVRALLQPGSQFGQTDVRLSVVEPARDTLQLFTDNQGVKATGLYEGGLFYRRHSLFGIDDRLTFYGIKSEGNLSGNIAYNVPFFLTDGRLGVSYSRGAIKIIDGPLAALDQRGSSQTTSVNLAQPLFVDDRWTVLLNLGSSYGTSASTISDTPITDNRTTKNGGGFTLTASSQNYSFSVSPNVAQALTRNELLGSKRTFTLVTGTTTNQVRLPEEFSLSLIGAGQYADVVLLPGDVLFNIGGPTTVRGYPSNASGGDSGYYTNLELHKNWNSQVVGLDTYLFTDFGQIYSTFPVNREAWSAGFGLSWTPASWVTTELSMGFPLKTLVANQSEFAIYYRISFRPL
jgi:hemolysin activation/secretion protein